MLGQQGPGRHRLRERGLVREDVTRAGILAAVQANLLTPTALTYLRKRIAEGLGEMSRNATRELDERRERLARTEERVARLVELIASGQSSLAVTKALADMEHQAGEERRAIAAAMDQSREPIRLPSLADVEAVATSLRDFFSGEEAPAAREVLRGLFADGRIRLVPGEDGYQAEASFFPLLALQTTKPLVLSGQGSSRQSHCCAGRISPDYTADFPGKPEADGVAEGLLIPWDFQTAKSPDGRRMPWTWRRRGCG